MLELSSWGRVRFECPNDRVGSVTKLLGLKILLKIYTWGFLHFPLPFCDKWKILCLKKKTSRHDKIELNTSGLQNSITKEKYF